METEYLWRVSLEGRVLLSNEEAECPAQLVENTRLFQHPRWVRVGKYLVKVNHLRL